MNVLFRVFLVLVAWFLLYYVIVVERFFGVNFWGLKFFGRVVYVAGFWYFVLWVLSSPINSFLFKEVALRDLS